MKKALFSGMLLAAPLFWSTSVLADGATTYNEVCVGCHGEDAKGAEGMNGVPDFTNAPAIWAKSDDQLAQSVIIGIEKPGAEVTMPPRAGVDELSDADIKEAVAYIRKTFVQ